MRVPVAEFGIIQKLLAGASVAIYEADEYGQITDRLAVLYQAETGAAARANPQVLNDNGMFEAPVWVEDTAVVAEISNISDRTERQLKKIRVNPLQYPLPITSAQLAGETAQVIIPNLAEIIAVANNIDHVVGVDANEDNINIVAADLDGDDTIGIVAADLSGPNYIAAVGANMASVVAVDDNKANINAVAGNATNINTVATNISDVNAVGANIAAVLAVNANAANINTVAGSASDINTVAGDIANVNTVAGNITSVNTVATNITSINAVEDKLTELTALYDDLDDLNTIYTNLPVIQAVNANEDNINAVNANEANINDAVAHMDDIIAAPAAADAAAQSAIDAANYAAALHGTSSSTVAVGLGTKTFTTQAGKQWQVGQRLRVNNPAVTRVMTGDIVSYSGTTLQLDVDYIEGTGSDNDWIIQISGERGEQGPAGNIADGDYGDITVSGLGSAMTVNDGLSAEKIANGSVSNTEFQSLDGISGNIQSMFDSVESALIYLGNNKQDNITGAATTIVASDLTASRALVSDASGKVAVSSITTTKLEYLANVNAEIQNQLNGKQPTITGAATTIASNNLTASRAVISNSSGKVAVSSVTDTELGYVSGVTSAIQTQLSGKQDTITGAATTITSTNLTASRALSSDASGKVAVATTTLAELDYLSGATSNVQDQLDAKITAPASPQRGDVMYYNGTAWARLAAGTSGQVLLTKGSGADPEWGSAGGAPDVQVFTSSGTYTTPAGAKWLEVECVGGGGGGVAAATTGNGGGGGSTPVAGSSNGGTGGGASSFDSLLGAGGGGGAGAAGGGVGAGAGSTSSATGTGNGMGSSGGVYVNPGMSAGSLPNSTNKGSGGLAAGACGGGGGYVKDIVANPSGSYAIGVGAGGSANGSSGYVRVIAHF